MRDELEQFLKSGLYHKVSFPYTDISDKMNMIIF